MKAAILLLFFFIVSAQCSKHSTVILQDENPAHPRQCYNEWEKKYYKVGETMKKNDNSCVKRVCNGLVQDTKMQITETSCGFVKAEGQCEKMAGDLKKNYPECCPTVKCPTAG